MSELETPQPTGISRRTVAKAMAWAVPAVAIAAPVPAYAGASKDFVTFTGKACKDPGDGTTKYYYFEVTITNSTGAPLLVEFTNVVVNGVTGTEIIVSNQAGASYTVPAYTECVVTLRFGVFPDSANGSATLYYDANGDAQDPAESGPLSLPPLPDNGVGNCPTSYPKEECTSLAV